MMERHCTAKLPIMLRVMALLGIVALMASVPAEAKSRNSSDSRASINAQTLCTRTTDTVTTTVAGRHRDPRPRHGHDDIITSQTFHRGRPGDRGTSVTIDLSKAFEIRWLKTNIDQHNRMISLAQAESEQTTSTELKTFSADLVTSLALEMAQMTTWLKEWYNIDYTPPTPMGPGPIGLTHCNLDQVFIAHVIGYEHFTINAAKFPAVRAIHTELVAFGAGMISEGQEILELMKSWQALFIQIDMENHFDRGGPQPGWAG